MSIHISCYTTYTLTELQERLNILSAKYPSIFPWQYELSAVCKPHPLQREIASEFGVNSCSYFVISVVNKALEISTDEIADIIRKELGKEYVIVLLNGEVPI